MDVLAHPEMYPQKLVEQVNAIMPDVIKDDAKLLKHFEKHVLEHPEWYPEHVREHYERKVEMEQKEAEERAREQAIQQARAEKELKERQVGQLVDLMEKDQRAVLAAMEQLNMSTGELCKVIEDNSQYDLSHVKKSNADAHQQDLGEIGEDVEVLGQKYDVSDFVVKRDVGHDQGNGNNRGEIGDDIGDIDEHDRDI